MLINTTSFIASHARATISATLHLTASLAVSLKSSLGWSARAKHVQEHEQDHVQGHENVQGQRQEQGRYQMEQQTLQQQHQHQQQQRGNHSSFKESSVVVGQDVDLRQNPMQHQPYPSLQPWKNLDTRIKNFGLMMPASANYAAPRHPIVLCHGLFGFDKMGPETIPPLQIHYWNGIQKALTKLGAKVVVARVPRTGGIQKRAEDLDRMLSRTMEGSPVNFVAHSMGGLDCRYLISHIRDKNYGVESLTTFSTPHYGSPMMDWFRDNIGVGLLQQSEEEAMRKLGGAAKMARMAAQEASDALNSYLNDGAEKANVPNYRTGPNPNLLSPLLNRLIPFLDTPAYANLTTTYCREVFNPNTPDDPNVSYYSYGASVPQIPLWAPLGFPWEIIKAKEGDNDGLVSVGSAKWGKYIETVECDHWDLNNRWRLKIGYGQKSFDAVELYMSAATRLFREGH